VSGWLSFAIIAGVYLVLAGLVALGAYLGRKYSHDLFDGRLI
jgi:hypothetical protein